MSTTYLVTGCSKGLGLAMATELSKTGSNFIFATARRETPSLKELVENSDGRVKYINLDVGDRSSIKEAEKQVEASLKGKGLDVLINNAAVLDWMTSGGIETMDNLDSMFHSNVTSVQMMTSAFLPLLRKGTAKKVVNLTSTMGSLAMSHLYARMPVPGYNITKTALNMLTVQWAQFFSKEGFAIYAVSPGWLRTDLGGNSADLDVETGAKATLEVISSHGAESSGKMWTINLPELEAKQGLNQYNGGQVPW